MREIASVCVFCGSSARVSVRFRTAAKVLGQLLAEAGITVVYGGGRVGLMGLMARAAMGAGGRVIGVIPEHLKLVEGGRIELSELHVVHNMHERKAKMFDLADAFVILPGGFGTLDETIEITTWKQLGLHDKPIVVVDVDGYWAPLRSLIESIITAGFARPETADLFTVVASVEDVLSTLAVAPSPATVPSPDLL